MLICKDATGVEIEPGDLVAFTRKKGQVTGTVRQVVVKTTSGYEGIINSQRVYVWVPGSRGMSMFRNPRNLLVLRKWDFE